MKRKKEVSNLNNTKAKEILKDLRTWTLQERKHTEERLRSDSGNIPSHTAFYDGMSVAYCNVLEKLYGIMKEVADEVDKGGGRI